MQDTMNVEKGFRLKIAPLHGSQPEIFTYVLKIVAWKRLTRVHEFSEFGNPPQALSNDFQIWKRCQIPKALSGERRMGSAGQVVKDLVEF